MATTDRRAPRAAERPRVKRNGKCATMTATSRGLCSWSAGAVGPRGHRSAIVLRSRGSPWRTNLAIRPALRDAAREAGDEATDDARGRGEKLGMRFGRRRIRFGQRRMRLLGAQPRRRLRYPKTATGRNHVRIRFTREPLLARGQPLHCGDDRRSRPTRRILRDNPILSFYAGGRRNVNPHRAFFFVRSRRM